MAYTSRYKSLFIFQLLCECHCWWTKESPRAHVAKFYGRLWLIRSVLRASKFSVLKLTDIVILRVYTFKTIPSGLRLIWHFLGIIFQLLNNFVWLRITDGGLLPKMWIWSILWFVNQIRLKMVYTSRTSLFSYIDKADSWAIKESTVTQSKLSNVLDIVRLFGLWGV